MTLGGVESPVDPPQPAKAATPAEFTVALRALRTWSGLTYRQLEGKSLDPLPASTIATTLGRATLPRERFVDAFTRACGLGDDQVREWLAARQRIAMSDGEVPEEPAPEPPPPAPRWRRVAGLVAAACVGAAAALGVSALTGDEPASPAESAGTPSVRGLDIPTVGSFARIHPGGDPDLCVTEGTDQSGQYDSAVAAQRPCTEVVLPHVFLEPVDTDVVQIQWHHPTHDIGCLTLLVEGPARDLVEPQDACADDNDQEFVIELVPPPA
jgi:hypothetical protein